MTDNHTRPASSSKQGEDELAGNEPGSSAFSMPPEAQAQHSEGNPSFSAENLLAHRDIELARLRSLLFGREIALLEKLRETLENPKDSTRMVSNVLAEAIQMRSGKDPHMRLALEPVIDNILKALLHKRRAEFAETLSPLMGPSIRKSITETFRSMLGSFSKSMEMAFSWKGLRWRLEAMRSGKSFSEIVMLHTLVYRVEQIFFIHSETGIALAHLANEGGDIQDADMVSAMLTAIQDFVRDCFARGDEGKLESLQLGEYTIFIEKTSLAYLACVVRGTPPGDFRTQLRAVLELLLVEYAEPLAEFSGNIGVFAGAARIMEPCLTECSIDADKKLPLWAKVVPVLVLVAIASGLGFLHYEKQGILQQKQLQEQVLKLESQIFTISMQGALDQLRAEPGLLVFHVAENAKEPWQVSLLKDDLARSPQEVLREKNMATEGFVFKTIPYISYDTAIITKRVLAEITLPDSVTMDFDGKGTLSFKGNAPLAWIQQTREQAHVLHGIDYVDMQGVRDPIMNRIAALALEVEGMVIEFPVGKDTPVPSDVPKLERAIESLVELEKIVNNMGFGMTLTVYGYADSSGTEKRNYEISQARARTVAAMLYTKGSSMPIAMYGMGSEYNKNGSEAETVARANLASRRIEFRIHVAKSAAMNLDTFLRTLMFQ